MAEKIPLITDVQESPNTQFRRRRRQYLVMMGLRVLCLIAATLAVMLQLPYTPVWVGLCLVGMVLLPWVAVLVANDRPRRQPTLMARFLKRQGRNGLFSQERARLDR